MVERFFFADVGNLIAPGGVGKTTLMIHIAAHIVLGRPVFGEPVRKPGPVLLVTAEDSREILVARLRAVMDAMGLDDAGRATVMAGVRIADVSGAGFKLTEVIGDVVLPSLNLNTMLEAAREIRPVLIVIDPAVSFGVGESRVNDAEQGLVEAARRLRNELNCCVLYIHHSGKANAREGTLDQYSGRGGSAFADGCRMVHVLQSLDATKWHDITGETLADGETGLILARPKISYCPPTGDIYIRRRGYRFERVQAAPNARLEKAEREGNQVWQLLTEELRQGRFHTKATLEDADAGKMTRKQIRSALSWLEVTGRVETRDRPGIIQRGARQYLHPLASPNADGEPKPEMAENEVVASPAENPFLASPPYREINGGEPSRPVLSPVSLASPNSDGEPRRGEAGRESDNADPELSTTVEDDL
ncbi:MAG: AAA family ATPase [Pseudomonadota bacterium]|nr:AAA family ATPase [Pseudomonadota bacterium]